MPNAYAMQIKFNYPNEMLNCITGYYNSNPSEGPVSGWDMLHLRHNRREGCRVSWSKRVISWCNCNSQATLAWRKTVSHETFLQVLVLIILNLYLLSNYYMSMAWMCVIVEPNNESFLFFNIFLYLTACELKKKHYSPFCEIKRN
jgi:hypothetical protein